MIYTEIREWDFLTNEKLQQNFTLEAIEELFRYYDELSEGFEHGIEFDPVGICCEWFEDSPKNIKDDYGIDEGQDLEEYLDYNTTYIKLKNGNILYIRF